MEINPTDLVKIDSRASNIYEAIIVTAQRARQINEEWRIEYNTMLNTMNPDGLDDEFEEKANQDRLNISQEFEKRAKPHMTALKMICDEGIKFRNRDEE